MKKSSIENFNPWPSFVDTVFIIVSILILFFLFVFLQLIQKQDFELTESKKSYVSKNTVMYAITLEENITFPYGMDSPNDLKPEAKNRLINHISPIIAMAVEEIEKNARPGDEVIIEIAGHADNKVHGDLDNDMGQTIYNPNITKEQRLRINLPFSTNRANAIIDYLSRELPLQKPELANIIIPRLKSSGYSMLKPSIKNASTKTDREQNRRIEIHVFALPKK